ncbi:VanZ family protein [Bittarella massiliensis (ex Durand et al. 2017)]|uniref:VanZ family protein n=1 Tax=Bittarella massiliensis (ex Durand et al. 2017) TaxID=1720313 RepID=UPI001AA18098|nr:VanZ family protein [Bittarella massiliensis (ex Durand et al. 2017)]MBO1678236.1 VanZ family protein [Bittarella massiliensis (ex Durand et al. 2017)]
MSIRRRRALFTALLILYTLFVFSNSLDMGPSSSSKSGAVLALINGFLNSFGLPLQLSEHFVRKAAHFAEYFVLGALALATFRQYTVHWRPHLALPLFYCLMVPLCDESIQLLVPGRSGQISDVWLDFAGALTGLAAALLFLLLWRRRRAKTRQN